MSIYKACDIRGKFGSELQVEHAVKLAGAISKLQKPGSVVVGGDGRLSTPALKEALVSSLLSNGMDVVDIGMAPTPLFYFARRFLGINTGVMVTASHNPAGDNGFKITLGELPITTQDMDAVRKLMEGADTPAGANEPGTLRKINLLDEYLNFLASHIPDLSGLYVIIDCANGMAGLAARRIWQKTGAAVTLLLEEVDGRFPAHSPNPAEAKNLALLQGQVRERRADLGVAYDGDADRVVFVDEKGDPVASDRAIVLFTRDALRDGAQTIVYDQKCSKIVPDTIRALGGTPLMQPSGHTFIKRAFLERQAAYAGELSGHHFLRSAHGDDALAASLFFARLLKESGLALSRLAGDIPAYPITPDLRIPMGAREITEVIDRLEAGLAAEAMISRADGLRIEYPDGWGLVRPSVTEPVITMRFEGTSAAALERILERIQEIAPQLRGKVSR